MALYQITVQTIRKQPDGWTSSTGCPTFFLDGDVQGIRDCTHAAWIALKVLDPHGVARESGVTFHVHVCTADGQSAHVDT